MQGFSGYVDDFLPFFCSHLEFLGKRQKIFISRQALARDGDYEMMSVRACLCVRALVSHADFSKTTTATDFFVN